MASMLRFIELKVARDNLKGGNLRQAISSYSRSKSKGQQFSQEADENRDLAQIEKEVRKAQVSNLIVAQNDFFVNNAGRIGDQQVLQMPINAPAQPPAEQQQQGRQAGQGQMGLNYDAEVAGQQWDKLEKAQQVAVAKVAPLRVSLPTRGVRFSFTQVLQTEIR